MSISRYLNGLKVNLWDLYFKVYNFFLFDSICSFCKSFCLNGICNDCLKIFIDRARVTKLPSLVFEKTLGKVYFDNLIFIFNYEDFRDFMILYKFGGRIDFVKYLSLFLSYDVFEGYDLYTFVPNHEGYSNFICVHYLSAKYGIRFVSFLDINPKNKKKQHLVEDRKERISNVRDKFFVKGGMDKLLVKLVNGKVLIFDDICTTGSTINEVSRVLKRINKDLRIDCLVICKAMTKLG
ncbi:MAG: hypothetical protein ABDH21_06420 [bacterium]